MLIHPTLDQLHQLGLSGMARAFTTLAQNPEAHALGHAEWLGLLLDHQITERQDRRLRPRLRSARLRHQATIEDVDYRTPRRLDRALFQALAGGQWIAQAHNLIIEGPTGAGKTWLACALAHKACRDNHSVLYQRLPRLLADLALGRGDGRHPRLMRALGGVKLLVLDDWGLEPLGAEQRRDLLDIVEERYGRGATLITSQLPVDRWHGVIGDPMLADAILDRLVHNAHRIPAQGRVAPQAAHARTRTRLTKPAREGERSTRPSRRSPPRPTSVGTGGRHGSERMADITSECPADFIGIRILAFPADCVCVGAEQASLGRVQAQGRSPTGAAVAALASVWS